MGVLTWNRPSVTIICGSNDRMNNPSVADPRALPPERPVISLELAVYLLAIGWEVPKRSLAPAIIARDGTWHRPLTTLELAILQTLPATLNGHPLVLAGKSDKTWREHIGNGIPRDAAEAWGRQLLETLTRNAMGDGWRLLSGGCWVSPAAEGLSA